MEGQEEGGVRGEGWKTVWWERGGSWDAYIFNISDLDCVVLATHLDTRNKRRICVERWT